MQKFQRDCKDLIRIVNDYISPPALTPQQQLLAELTAVSARGRVFLGPWGKLSQLLGFGHTWSGHLRSLVPSDFLFDVADLGAESDTHTRTNRGSSASGTAAAAAADRSDAPDLPMMRGFIGVSPEGLALACAQTKHATELLDLLPESPSYTNLHASFRRLANDPRLPADHAHLRSVTVTWSGGLPWFFEDSILSVFGAVGVAHPERLTEALCKRPPVTATQLQPRLRLVVLVPRPSNLLQRPVLPRSLGRVILLVLVLLLLLVMMCDSNNVR